MDLIKTDFLGTEVPIETILDIQRPDTMEKVSGIFEVYLRLHKGRPSIMFLQNELLL